MNRTMRLQRHTLSAFLSRSSTSSRRLLIHTHTGPAVVSHRRRQPSQQAFLHLRHYAPDQPMTMSPRLPQTSPTLSSPSSAPTRPRLPRPIHTKMRHRATPPRSCRSSRVTQRSQTLPRRNRAGRCSTWPPGTATRASHKRFWRAAQTRTL
ncbi:hypothetical protein BCR44DRAFT_1050196 [Catenaria anguillulae PL171]|uniref:Uncharacterized protein n=1 Tax=Catenaria anguillulae PL171 TaxID=765915 RepID=A0A1Y2HQY4_9FUNG|nr:hypothetical protein BCR44DRAFT_1050196 [Catenaria anguillulae PL171]